MTLRIPNAGSPMYIPRFNAITDSPSPKTSDSDSAFCIIVNYESIGVKPSLIAYLQSVLSHSMSAIVGENV